MAVKPTAPLLEGRRVEGGRASAGGAGECTYTVAEVPARSAEKRSRHRRRTRLRTGKIVDAAGRFLTECLVHDRSDTGGRLRLPAGIVVPGTIQLYDDQSASLVQAVVVWRLDQEIGVRFRPAPPTERSRALEADLRRRFYAVQG